MENELKHYGVLGMRWGVRKGRYTAAEATRTNIRKSKRYAKADYKTFQLTNKEKSYSEKLAKKPDSERIKRKIDKARAAITENEEIMRQNAEGLSKRQIKRAQKWIDSRKGFEQDIVPALSYQNSKNEGFNEADYKSKYRRSRGF